MPTCVVCIVIIRSEVGNGWDTNNGLGRLYHAREDQHDSFTETCYSACALDSSKSPI